MLSSKTKSIMCGLLALCILLVSMVSMTGCTKESTNSDTVVHYVVGEKPENFDKIISLINERTQKELGLNLELKFVTRDKYAMLNTGGEYFDSIQVTEALGYWGDVKRDAYAEITREELEKYAPFLAKVDEEIMKAASYDGKMYAIPSLTTNYNTNCWVVRGDFMDKAGVEKIENLDDVEKYLTWVAENEKDIIPYNVNTAEAYVLPSAFVTNEGWAAAGGTNSVAPVQLSEVPGTENYLQLFNVIEQPEIKEFSERMKRWREKGFWSKSAMSNKTRSPENFKGGRSATARYTLDEYVKLKEDFSKDERKSWDIRAYYTFSKHPIVYSRMIGAVAISSASTNKENTLRMLDFLLSDAETYRLLNYGIEGENYTLPDGEHISRLGGFSIGYSTGIVNADIGYDTYYSDPEAYELLDEIKAKIDLDKVGSVVRGFNPDLSELDVYTSALNQIYQEYTIPRILGFVDDVDAAIEIEKKKLYEAGINEYREKLQAQFDEYCKEKGLK